MESLTFHYGNPARGRKVDIVDVVAQHSVERGSPRLCPASQADVELAADRNAILRVRGMLAIDGTAFHAVAAGPMSLTRSATESQANFVRRVTLAALDAALGQAS